MADNQTLTQIRIGGFGGQGVVLAGALLGHAAVRDGRRVSGSNAYGAQARGGAARSEVVISDGPIAFPHVLQADILVAMSQGAYDAFKENLADEGAVVLYDTTLVDPSPLKGVRHHGVPATDAAVSGLQNKQVANIVMLGALAALTGVVSRTSLEATIEDQVDSRFRDLNLRALAEGIALGEGSRDR